MSGIHSIAAPPAAPQARRVVFVDLARAVAAVLMLYGHALDALLAPHYRTGAWHTVWLFQRGLTSCLFLLLSGFAFSIATTRHWPAQLVASPTLLRRGRRFGLLILIGYALHVPVLPFSALLAAPDSLRQRLWEVDILQLIGVTFIAVQVLVIVLRSRAAVTAATFVLAATIPIVTPMVWNASWPRALHPVVAGYLTPAGGSLFPLFPWAAFILLGVALGQLYSRWDVAALPRYAGGVLLAPAAGLLAVWLAWRAATGGLLGTGAYNDVPAQVLLRAASCLLILAAVALVSRRLTRLPTTVSAFAQETLIVYVVHICIVYGSVWNPGLAHVVPLQLSPAPMVLTVAALVGLMGALAGLWHRWKHMHPRRARGVSLALGALLLFRLVVPLDTLLASRVHEEFRPLMHLPDDRYLDSRFCRLTGLADLDRVTALSETVPVFVFKHSKTCGTSAEAHEELSALLEEGVGAAWYVVDVREHRSVSTAIAERFGVRHESPQILLLANGQVRWSASHYRVTAANAQAALARLL